MDDIKRQILARALLGRGALGAAADTQKLYPVYQKAQIEAQMSGEQLPPFEQWVQMQQEQDQEYTQSQM